MMISQLVTKIKTLMFSHLGMAINQGLNFLQNPKLQNLYYLISLVSDIKTPF